MTKRDDLQRRISELEAKESPTPEEKAELKQKQQELKKSERESQPATLCSHREARLEHRFCPTCGGIHGQSCHAQRLRRSSRK